jgi:hypothetical protein
MSSVCCSFAGRAFPGRLGGMQGERRLLDFFAAWKFKVGRRKFTDACAGRPFC